MKVTVQQPEQDADGNVTIMTLEQELEIIKSCGKGDFNAYFEVECNGVKKFMKTYWDSAVCAGSTSRNIIRNEAEILKDKTIDSLFYGWTEINDRLCLLFEHAGDYKDTLEAKLGVDNSFMRDLPSPDTGSINRGIVATHFNEIYRLDQVHDIISKLLEKVKQLHAQS